MGMIMNYVHVIDTWMGIIYLLLLFVVKILTILSKTAEANMLIWSRMCLLYFTLLFIRVTADGLSQWK